MFWRVVESLVSETFLLTSHHTAPSDQGVSIPVVSGTSAAHLDADLYTDLPGPLMSWFFKAKTVCVQ